MAEKTRSFEVRALTAAGLAASVVARAPRLTPGEVGLIFCTREAKGASREIAAQLKSSPGTWVIATGHGVASERGEIEGEIAATGMTLGSNHGRVIARESADPDFGAELGAALSKAHGASALALVRADQLDEDWMYALAETGQNRQGCVFGGATEPETMLHVAENSRVRGVKAIAIVQNRSQTPQLVASAACRLISPLGRVTAAEGPVVISIDDNPALTALGDAAEELKDQSPILVAQAPTTGGLSPDGRVLALKPLAGIDPTRGALILSSDIAVGTRVAFAVRDGRTGRQDFEAHLRKMAQQTRGGAPEFGILVSCAGRGRDLFGAASTDARLIKARFPEVPFIGFSSYFELGEINGRLTSQIYAGIFALYSLPS
jgi:small ligand-binding sensory domain FIST